MARLDNMTALGAALLVLASACGTSPVLGDRHSVEWYESANAAPVAQVGVAQLLAEPWLDPIEVYWESGDGERITGSLESCGEYLDAAHLRVRPVHGGTTAAIFQARALHCQALTMVLDAAPAVVSYLRPFAFDEGLPDRAPWQLATIWSASEAQQIAAERPDATWRQALFAPLDEFSACGTHCGRYIGPGAVQAVRLVARGDFDGDGVEDMLVSSSEAARGGSYQAYRMLVLTRRMPDGRVELVRELEY